MINDNLNALWKALSDPTRRHILDLLRQAPRTTGELSDIFAEEMSRYAVMKHLTVLEEASLIVIRRKGRERYNHLNFVPLQEMYERWLRPYEAQWARSLINMKNQAEGVNNMATALQDNTVTLVNVEQDIQINASVEKTYEAILNVNAWWLQRVTDNPDALRLEAKVGGRFWETRDGSDDSGFLFATVTSIEPHDHISLTGNMGMPGAGQGNTTFQVIAQDDGTSVIKHTSQFMGILPDGFEEGLSNGWEYGLHGLKKFIETGEKAKLPTQGNH